MKYLKRIFSKSPDNSVIQFLRYGFSSGIAFALDFTLLAVLNAAGLNLFIANIISFLSGLTITYILSNIWVFTGAKRKNKYVEFAVFVAVGLAALGVNELILYVFHINFGIHPLIAKIIAAGVTVIFNYVLRKTILYSKKAGEES